MPRRAPGWPLAATLGAHLLLAWWWLDATGVRLQPSSAPALREFFVVPALVPVLVPPPPPPVQTSRPASPARAMSPAASRAAPRDPVEATTIAAAPTVAPSAAPAHEPDADPLAMPPSQDGATPEESTLAGRARRAAGSTDHALRQGKLAPLAPTDTPWKRFAAAVEDARKDDALTLTSESYTSPDGTIVYRFRKNGRYYCRTGGGVKPGLFGAEGGAAVLFDKAGGGGSAGLIRCPSQAEFTPD